MSRGHLERSSCRRDARSASSQRRRSHDVSSVVSARDAPWTWRPISPPRTWVSAWRRAVGESPTRRQRCHLKHSFDGLGSSYAAASVKGPRSHRASRWLLCWEGRPRRAVRDFGSPPAAARRPAAGTHPRPGTCSRAEERGDPRARWCVGRARGREKRPTGTHPGRLLVGAQTGRADGNRHTAHLAKRTVAGHPVADHLVQAVGQHIEEASLRSGHVERVCGR